MIEIIVGTNRPGSKSLLVAKQVQNIYSSLGTESQILTMADLPAELFNPSSYAEKPASFAPIQKRVLDAKGLHIVTPEYNGGYPGVFKYFIDMLQFPESFEHKRVCFTGVAAGIWGAIRPIEQLQMVFGYRNSYTLPERVFMAKIYENMNEQGEITNELYKDLLNKQCQAFVKWVSLD